MTMVSVCIKLSRYQRSDDVVGSAIFAFGLSVSVACLMRLFGGPEFGRLLATGGVPVGFLAGVAWISGVSSGIESSLSDQILYTVLGGACLGILLDMLKVGRLVRVGSCVGFVLCVYG